MSKISRKLSVKKETLRKLDSLSDQQMRAVGGGLLEGYSIVVPPKGTFGCTTDFQLVYEYDYVYYK